MYEPCTLCGIVTDDHFGPGLCIHCFTGKKPAQDPPADEAETEPVHGRTVPCDTDPDPDPDTDPDADPEEDPAPDPEPAAGADPDVDVFNYQW